ncbi:ANTAR domain-containing protein [Kutzneria buriramensis]|nr:ANTAR domain-containing protein [Kutzneria buriramensis]
MDRRARRAFVVLADNLVTDCAPIDYLGTLAQTAADLLESACAVLLTGRRNALGLVATSANWPGPIEMSEPWTDDRPGMNAFPSGPRMYSPDLTEDDHWALFTSAVLTARFGTVQAFSMRVWEQTVGVMCLLSEHPGNLDAALAQALANLATIGVLSERARDSAVVIDQLQHALGSRVTIEQAKGILAERLQVSVDDAFSTLRRHARSNNLKLDDVARAVVAGDLPII